MPKSYKTSDIKEIWTLLHSEIFNCRSTSIYDLQNKIKKTTKQDLFVQHHSPGEWGGKGPRSQSGQR